MSLLGARLGARARRAAACWAAAWAAAGALAACHGPAAQAPAATQPQSTPIEHPAPGPDAIARAIRSIPPAPIRPGARPGGGLGPTPPAPPAPMGAAGPASDDRSCAAGGECAAVPSGCCGCEAGGGARGIRAEARAGYVALLARRCAGVLCTAMMSDDPTCAAAPRCVAGRCRLVDRSGTPVDPL